MSANSTIVPVPSPADTPWIDDYAMERVSFHAARLAASLNLGEHDEEDLRQDFIAELCSAQRRFNPNLASKRTFVCRVLSKASAYFARTARSKRRRPGRPIASLSAIKAERSAGALAGTRVDEPAVRVDLATDIAGASDRLDDRGRRLVHELSTRTPREIAAERGVHPSTVYRELAAVRAVFAELSPALVG
jgi:DNA-directed RNA polymerase specialized sigma24 family protein